MVGNLFKSGKLRDSKMVVSTTCHIYLHQRSSFHGNCGTSCNGTTVFAGLRHFVPISVCDDWSVFRIFSFRATVRSLGDRNGVQMVLQRNVARNCFVVSSSLSGVRAKESSKWNTILT